MEIKSGNTITLTGCNGVWLMVAADNGRIKVQPEDLSADCVWVSLSEVTGLVTEKMIHDAVSFFADNGDVDSFQTAIDKFAAAGARA